MSQQSFVNGLSDVPAALRNDRTVVRPRRSEIRALRCADRAAAACSLDVRGMKERVDTLAAAFLALGLEPGERIGIWRRIAPNGR